MNWIGEISTFGQQSADFVTEMSIATNLYLL